MIVRLTEMNTGSGNVKIIEFLKSLKFGHIKIEMFVRL